MAWHSAGTYRTGDGRGGAGSATVRRAIDLHEGGKINEAAFKQLIQAAVAANSAVLAERAAKKK